MTIPPRTRTLPVRERAVVGLLLGNGNASSQNIIKQKTGIPRTTLIRVLDALEAKKIITTESMGKLKKVRLTPWFLEKD